MLGLGKFVLCSGTSNFENCILKFILLVVRIHADVISVYNCILVLKIENIDRNRNRKENDLTSIAPLNGKVIE